jgi:hypothetical protein
MDADTPIVEAQDCRLCYDWFAWICAIIPLYTAVLLLAWRLAPAPFAPSSSRPILDFIARMLVNQTSLRCNFLAVVFGLILGIISLLNLRYHRLKSSKRVAAVGLVLNVCAAPVAFVGYLITGLGHNC